MGEQLHPSTGEINAFLATLRAQRERLADLARQNQLTEADELVEAVDAIGEQLLVADEELRAQSEHIAQASRQLDLLVAAYEELFTNASVAYLETDAAGVVQRMNRAARRLLRISGDQDGRHTLLGLLRPADRGPVRALLSRLRVSRTGAAFGERLPALEVAVLRPDGSEVPVLLNARRSSVGDDGEPTIHWEFEQHAAAGDSERGTPSTVPPPVFELIARAASDLAAEDSPERILARVAEQARLAVPSCDEVGVTLVGSRGHFESPAATGGLARACDLLQHDLHEGPCVEAIETSTPLRVTNLATDRRWPRFTPQATGLGVHSVLAVPMSAGRTTGALNLYARETARFGGADERVGRAFATHAGIALAHAEMAANLRTGLLTREEIGRAVGILMERHRVTAKAAFDMLVLASQHSHRKLRDLAAWMNETGEDPSSLIRDRRAN